MNRQSKRTALTDEWFKLSQSSAKHSPFSSILQHPSATYAAITAESEGMMMIMLICIEADPRFAQSNQEKNKQTFFIHSSSSSSSWLLVAGSGAVCARNAYLANQANQPASKFTDASVLLQFYCCTAKNAEEKQSKQANQNNYRQSAYTKRRRGTGCGAGKLLQIS